MPATRRELIVALAGLSGLGRAGRAADYPDRPVRLVVSFTAGGTTDIIARLVGNVLAELWSQPVLIDNRPGAGGNIGTEQVARAAPDGHTLLVGSVGPLAVNQTLYRNLPYDVRRDFAPITLLAGVPNILVVLPGASAGSVDELVELARRRPREVSYASTGIGTSSHLSGVLMEQLRQVELTHVPYRGAVAINDLLSGRVTCMFATIPSVIEQVRAGRLRALAVSSRQRSRATPLVPTMEELGFAGFDASSWFGLVAPARTPQPIIDRVHADAVATLRRPEIERQMVAQGADPVGNTPAEFAAFLDAEIDRWAGIVRASGATVE